MTALTTLAVSYADVLQLLQAEPAATTAQISAATGRVKNNVARDIGKLIKAGLVDDARGLTPDGEAMVALLTAAPPSEPATDATAAALPGHVALIHAQIRTSPLNPRKFTDEDEAGILELADSIAQDGLLENLVVRPCDGQLHVGAGWTERLPLYTLVAGERRWRAIKELISAGRWDAEAPLVCKLVEIDDTAHRRIALVENLQRKDLRPIDEAVALKELMAVTGVGTAEVAKEIGFTQRFVQQRVQLLELEPDLQDLVNSGTWTIEQARRSIASRPKPLVLKPAEKLMLVEIAVFLAGRGALKAGKSATVGGAAREDQVAERLRKGGAIYVTKDWNTGQDQVQINEVGVRTILEAWPDFNRLKTDSISERDRSTIVAEVRTLVEGPPPTGKYVTPWLNAPFELHPSEVQRLERAKEQEAARAQRMRDEESARLDLGRRGTEAIARVRTFEAETANMGAAEYGDLLTDQLRALGFTPPFRAEWDGRQVLMVDADGNPWAAAGGVFEALRRLTILTINRALGCDPVTGPDLLETPWSEGAMLDGEDAGEDEPGEPEGEDEDEIPPAVRRLVEPTGAAT